MRSRGEVGGIVNWHSFSSCGFQRFERNERFGSSTVDQRTVSISKTAAREQFSIILAQAKGNSRQKC